MSEIELSETLGMLSEPTCNRLVLTPELAKDIIQISMAFKQSNLQRSSLGTINPDLWLEFIPWHSLN